MSSIYTFTRSRLPCVLAYDPPSTWCGYVGVSEGHPAYDKDVQDLPHLEVFGGIAWAGHPNRADAFLQPHLIHLDAKFWWIGFNYRGDDAYAKDQCRRLARQLAKLQAKAPNQE